MTLATEPPDTPAPETHAAVSLLEHWPDNERMRHIPALPWLVQKLDGDLRRRIDLLLSSFANIAAEEPKHAELEKEFRALSRDLDHLADVARRARGVQHHHPPAELAARIHWSINHAVSMLNGAESETFGRRFPFQTFERSNAEPLWGAMLAVIQHVHRLTELVRPFDRAIDERMYEGLVTLQTPLDPRPIA